MSNSCMCVCVCSQYHSSGQWLSATGPSLQAPGFGLQAHSNHLVGPGITGSQSTKATCGSLPTCGGVTAICYNRCTSRGATAKQCQVHINTEVKSEEYPQTEDRTQQSDQHSCWSGFGFSEKMSCCVTQSPSTRIAMNKIHSFTK